jgi:hypothetical protein
LATTHVLNEIARMYERRSDASRVQRAAPKVSDLAAILARTSKLPPRPAQSSTADTGTGHPDVLGKPSAPAAQRVSVRVQIVERERPPAEPASVAHAPAAAEARPRPLALPLPPVQPEAATRAGTAEAHRAVAAYGVQRELYNRARHDDDQQALQSLRMRA